MRVSCRRNNFWSSRTTECSFRPALQARIGRSCGACRRETESGIVGGVCMMSMIGHALMGLLIGLVARAVLPGKQHMGLILTMLLGMVGAWLGGLIGRMTGMYEEG